MLDGLVVLVHVAQGGGNVVVGLSQQATVCRQVLQLQSQTVLEVLQRLWIVACGNKSFFFFFRNKTSQPKIRKTIPIQFSSIWIIKLESQSTHHTRLRPDFSKPQEGLSRH